MKARSCSIRGEKATLRRVTIDCESLGVPPCRVDLMGRAFMRCNNAVYHNLIGERVQKVNVCGGNTFPKLGQYVGSRRTDVGHNRGCSPPIRKKLSKPSPTSESRKA